MKALASGLRSRPVDSRVSIVTAFMDGSLPPQYYYPWGPSKPLVPSGAAEKNAYRRAVEELLVSELLDEAAREGMSMGRGGEGRSVEFRDPRICDLAAFVLSENWPKKYAFRSVASKLERDRIRVSNANVWRKEHGLPPLARPAAPVIVSAPAKALQPLLNQALSTGAEVDRRRALTTIEAMGLPAYSGVSAALKRLEPEHPARADFEETVRRIGCVVRDFALAGPKSAMAKVRPRLLALKGKPLTTQAFTGVLLAILNDWPSGVHGLRFVAEREGDGTGFALRLDLLDKPDPGLNRMDYHESVTVGDMSLDGSSGGASLEYARSPTFFDDLGRAIHLALSEPPNQTVRITFSMTLGKKKDDGRSHG